MLRVEVDEVKLPEPIATPLSKKVTTASVGAPPKAAVTVAVKLLAWLLEDDRRVRRHGRRLQSGDCATVLRSVNRG